MKRSNYLLVLAAGLLLAACQHNMPLGAGFGNSVQHNNALHIVDPNPAMATDVAVEMNGNRAGSAIGRYETGTVIEPSTPATTSSNTN